MGSSGRSTGPHVHFEVFKNGRIVDPSAYIHRASR
jgi:murein DD-endopeptidase MepM/ murein hydrolase activator NlpD